MPASAAIWVGLGLTGIWLVWYLRRVQVYWDTGDSRITVLGQSLRQMQRALSDEQRNLEKMEREIKTAQAQAKNAQRDAQELQQQRQNAAPPAPIEILVAAEFPSSASEDPWIANMVRRFGPSSDAKTTPVLFWAAGYPAAQARARQIAVELQLAVNDIRRLAGASA